MRSFSLTKLRQNLLLFKYLLTSASVYIYILGAIYVLVDVCKFEKIFSYIIVYVTAYVIEYTLTLRFVFNEQHRWIKVIKYITYVAMFLGFSTYFFKLLLSFGVYYLLATLLVALALMPVRFIVNKYWVYR